MVQLDRSEMSGFFIAHKVINIALNFSSWTKYGLEFKIKNPKRLIYSMFRILKSDLDWIQTSNLLSRNQVRYSVAPQGHFAVVIITRLRVQI